MAQTFDLTDVKRRMQGAIAALKHDLNSLRTGRASPSVLDPIMVDAYGSKMPLSQVATVSVPEARLSTSPARGLGGFLDAAAGQFSSEGITVHRLPLLSAPFSSLAKADELPEGGTFLIG